MIDRPPSKSDINKRFTLVFLKLEEEGIIANRDRSEVAKKLNLDPSRLTEILKGRRNVSAEEIANFAMIYSVNPFYILYESLPIRLLPDNTEDFLSQSYAKFVHLNVHLNVHLTGNLPAPGITPAMMAAEDEFNRNKHQQVVISATVITENGKKEPMALSLEELSKLLGITELNERLKLLLSKSKYKK